MTCHSLSQTVAGLETVLIWAPLKSSAIARTQDTKITRKVLKVFTQEIFKDALCLFAIPLATSGWQCNKADRHKSRAPSLQLQTPTDRQSDRPTNRPTEWLMSRVHATKKLHQVLIVPYKGRISAFVQKKIVFLKVLLYFKPRSYLYNVGVSSVSCRSRSRSRSRSDSRSRSR